MSQQSTTISDDEPHVEKNELIEAVENDPAVETKTDARTAVERHTANELYTETKATTQTTSRPLRNHLTTLTRGIVDTFWSLDAYSLSTATAFISTTPEQNQITISFTPDQPPLYTSNETSSFRYSRTFTLSETTDRDTLDRLINHLPEHITNPGDIDGETIPIRFNHRTETPEIDIPPAELWNRPQYYIGRIKRRLNIYHDNNNRRRNHSDGQRLYLFNALLLAPTTVPIIHYGVDPDNPIFLFLFGIPAMYSLAYTVAYTISTPEHNTNSHGINGETTTLAVGR